MSSELPRRPNGEEAAAVIIMQHESCHGKKVSMCQ